MLDGSTSTTHETSVFTHPFSRTELHARFLRRKLQQSAWDAEESRDLRAAEQTQHWTHYACVTLLEYLETFGGIEPRTALDRIRVSHALGELPLLEAELEDGTFQFSHVKELARILVPDTEEEWIAHTRGMTYREVQRAVAGHVRGDRPTDPTQPDERRMFVGFHVKASTRARFNALVRALEQERGDKFVDDDDRLNTICDRLEVTVSCSNATNATNATTSNATTSNATTSNETTSNATTSNATTSNTTTANTTTANTTTSSATSSNTTTGNATSLNATSLNATSSNAMRSNESAKPHEHSNTCHGCASAPTQVWITTDGHAFANGTELDDAELATLLCDATIMGHVDDPDARPVHTLKPKQRRRILARDMNQCRVPGCRARHHLDVHHIVHREDGGDDADANLVTLCSGHHRLHHAGFLEITGRAPRDLTFRRVNADEDPRPR